MNPAVLEQNYDKQCTYRSLRLKAVLQYESVSTNVFPSTLWLRLEWSLTSAT